ncbi:MAG: 3-oxoadipyl-CoA thiolase [Bryobacterales bacterium]|nr:3-oxoadipyl-CoA thiolase [Bryobacterales bacterium]
MPTAYICEGVRTPIGRYGGALATVRADDLAAHPLATLKRRFENSDWESIDEIYYGCVTQAGEDNRNVARMALLLADFPISVPGVTVNRLCASSMEAVAVASRGIIAGELSLAIAGGIESMSRSPWVMPKPSAAFPRDPQIYDTTLGWRFVNPLMEQKYGTISMAETAENVAEKYNIDRASQDRFALGSQQKAAKAKAAGVFAEEIEPVCIPGKKGAVTMVAEDEHPRADTTLEALSKLPTPFRKGGTVTAGNASGINDGAVAMFVASEQAAAKFGLTPIARFVGASAAGVDPNYMGIGPIPAIQKLLSRLNMKMDDVDFLELNEAFAAQALACTRAFGLADDSEKVNPNGGAIALGHPLGMSGARLVLTSAMHLKRTGARRAIASMCVGVGQGMALLLERV